MEQRGPGRGVGALCLAKRKERLPGRRIRTGEGTDMSSCLVMLEQRGRGDGRAWSGPGCPLPSPRSGKEDRACVQGRWQPGWVPAGAVMGLEPGGRGRVGARRVTSGCLAWAMPGPLSKEESQQRAGTSRLGEELPLWSSGAQHGTRGLEPRLPPLPSARSSLCLGPWPRLGGLKPSGACGFCIANQTRTFWCLWLAKGNFLFLREKDEKCLLKSPLKGIKRLPERQMTLTKEPLNDLSNKSGKHTG